MVERVIGLDSQLGINTLGETEVLCRGDVPIVNTRSVECSAIPGGADFALGRKREHVWVEIVVEGALALRQDRNSCQNDLRTIAPAGYVLVVCRARGDIHWLAG